jgi:hypothetical protein
MAPVVVVVFVVVSKESLSHPKSETLHTALLYWSSFLTVYRCRSVAGDELENAEYIGINVYVDCDSSLVGYETLLSDFTGYGLTVPVIVSRSQLHNDSTLSLRNITHLHKQPCNLSCSTAD